MCSFASKTAFLYSSFVIDDFVKEGPQVFVWTFIDPAVSLGLKYETAKIEYKPNQKGKRRYFIHRKDLTQILTLSQCAPWIEKLPNDSSHLDRLPQSRSIGLVLPNESHVLSGA